MWVLNPFGSLWFPLWSILMPGIVGWGSLPGLACVTCPLLYRLSEFITKIDEITPVSCRKEVRFLQPVGSCTLNTCIYKCLLCCGRSLLLQPVNQKTLTCTFGHLVPPLVSKDQWLSTMVHDPLCQREHRSDLTQSYDKLPTLTGNSKNGAKRATYRAHENDVPSLLTDWPEW